MANEVKSGFLREAVSGGSLGALVVSAPTGNAAVGAPVSGEIFDAGADVAVLPKYKLLNLAASQTASTVVAAVALKKIRVLAAVFVAGAVATNLTFNSASAAISCLFANGANSGACLPFNEAGWFETVAGEALTATTGAGSTTGIQLTYIEVA